MNRGTKSLGMTAEQLRQIITSSIKGIPDLSKEEANIILGAPGTLAQGIAAAFEPFKKVSRVKQESGPSRNSFLLDVPYARERTIANLLKLGRYDWENSDITDQHFPQLKIGKERIRVRLEHFGQVVTTRKILADFRQRKLRPINVPELLALGAIYPYLQRKYPVIALGQEWRFSSNNAFVVCLAWHGMLRRIYLLSRSKREWPAHCRFPAVSLAK